MIKIWLKKLLFGFVSCKCRDCKDLVFPDDMSNRHPICVNCEMKSKYQTKKTSSYLKGFGL